MQKAHLGDAVVHLQCFGAVDETPCKCRKKRLDGVAPAATVRLWVLQLLRIAHGLITNSYVREYRKHGNETRRGPPDPLRPDLLVGPHRPSQRRVQGSQ